MFATEKGQSVFTQSQAEENETPKRKPKSHLGQLTADEDHARVKAATLKLEVRLFCQPSHLKSSEQSPYEVRVYSLKYESVDNVVSDI